MKNKNLGRIEEVDLREVFSREDKDFTPWAKENIDILSKKLGIEIIDIRTEEPIGNFRLDIIGTDANTKKIVAIENQIEPTDHNHLGQLITYSSGINAGIIIWIAKDFREEHKNALEWLNENSDQGISFFGIEVKTIRIDDSKPAVDFRIIIQPNEWQRSVRETKQIVTETTSKYLNFYGKLVDAYNKEVPTWYKKKPQPQSWLSFGAGKSGLAFTWAFKSNNRFAIELYISTGDKNENKRLFEELEAHKDEINNKISNLSWEKVEDKKDSRIALYRDIKGNINKLSEDDYDEIIKWAVENMKKFSLVFSEYIKNL